MTFAISGGMFFLSHPLLPYNQMQSQTVAYVLTVVQSQSLVEAEALSSGHLFPDLKQVSS